MGWFGSVLETLQKERWVSLPKAQKIDEELKLSLRILSQRLDVRDGNEIIQLQTALQTSQRRAVLVKAMERDLVSAGERVAVQEKVHNQIISLHHFFETSMALFRRDWEETKGDWRAIGEKRASRQNLGKVETFLRKQLAQIEVLKKQIPESQDYSFLPPVLAAGCKRNDDKKAARINIEIASLNRKIKMLEDHKKTVGQDYAALSWARSDLGQELGDFWKSLASETAKVEMPSIKTLTENEHTKQFRSLVEEEIKALVMALTHIEEQLELMEKAGIKIVPKAEERKVKRATSFLARAVA